MENSKLSDDTKVLKSRHVFLDLPYRLFKRKVFEIEVSMTRIQQISLCSKSFTIRDQGSRAAKEVKYELEEVQIWQS